MIVKINILTTQIAKVTQNVTREAKTLLFTISLCKDDMNCGQRHMGQSILSQLLVKRGGMPMQETKVSCLLRKHVQRDCSPCQQ